uniref:Talin-1 n=1 Tax=Mus musculus TaxID=10090 RepID=UPI0029677B98|nr:Chain A, Talin-1 [Mus musculus]8IVZ_B Chain B, Talin-1 [Mus musculus]
HMGSAPGQKECDNALRQLETVRELLENPVQPINDMSYFGCLDSVMENSKVLGEAMTGISQNAKNGNLPEFGDAIATASKALCGFTEAAAQAAYLVGVSDPNSQAQISPEGRAAMEPIVISAKTMLESAGGLIQTARALAVNPRDPPRWSVLAGHSRTVSDSIKKLITSMRD